jgi:glycerophosphoryl diester phosphodiesterase
VLVARHEPEISGTTDVADHPELAERRTTRELDGVPTTGWFADDLTLAELKTVRARERIPRLRPGSARYDGCFEVPTFAEAIDLRARLSAELGREIGLYAETKRPTYFRARGLPLEQRLVDALRSAGLDGGRAPVFVQSFEVGSLTALAGELDVPLVQLLGAVDARPRDFVLSGDERTYADLAAPRGLLGIAAYARAVGPPKELVVPRDDAGSSRPPTRFVEHAHAAGLLVHPYTFRPENAFLPLELRSSADPAEPGDLASELRRFAALEVDGVFTDVPGEAVAALA